MSRAIGDDDVLDMMGRYGGSFMQAYAVAYRMADTVNRFRLRTAFADEWTRYRAIADHVLNPLPVPQARPGWADDAGIG